MPSFEITFNKVASELHFGEPDTKALQVSVIGNELAFRVADDPLAPDACRLTPRTRGGLEITLDGDLASLVLEQTGLLEGDYVVLGKVVDGWITSRRYVQRAGQDKPSKIYPAARLWSIRNQQKAAVTPAQLGLQFSPTSEAEGKRTFKAHVFAANGPAEARAKANIFKLWRWCSANLKAEQWTLEATQTATQRLTIDANGVDVDPRQTANYVFDLTLSCTSDADAELIRKSCA